MAVTYALSTPMTYKAGANVSSTATAAPQLLEFGLEAEAFINLTSGYDWSAWYTLYAVTYPHVERLLVDAAACKGAIDIINYDMSGFMNIQEAVSRINTLYTMLQLDLSLLKEERTKDQLRVGGPSA